MKTGLTTCCWTTGQPAFFDPTIVTHYYSTALKKPTGCYYMTVCGIDTSVVPAKGYWNCKYKGLREDTTDRMCGACRYHTFFLKETEVVGVGR